MAKLEIDKTIGQEFDDIEDILEVIRYERDLWTMENIQDLRHRQPGSFINGQMLMVMGAQVYRDVHLPGHLRKYAKQTYKTHDIVDENDSEHVRDAAIFAWDLLNKHSRTFRETGKQMSSLRSFVRTVGETNDFEFRFEQLKYGQRNLPSRPVVSFVYSIPYAGWLETFMRKGQAHGVLYYVAKQVRLHFGAAIMARFDFIQGSRFVGYNYPYPLPRLQIASPRNLKRRGWKPRATRVAKKDQADVSI